LAHPRKIVFEVARFLFVDPEVEPHVMLVTVEGAANWYDVLSPSIPFDITAALTVNIVSLVNPVIARAWVVVVVFLEDSELEFLLGMEVSHHDFSLSGVVKACTRAPTLRSDRYRARSPGGSLSFPRSPVETE
jgi:hypothetical protein